jgi:hypothetical protein
MQHQTPRSATLETSHPSQEHTMQNQANLPLGPEGMQSKRSKSLLKGAALTTVLGIALAVAQNADSPFVVTGSGIRIPNATLQAYNDAGGIAAVLSNTQKGASDAAVVLLQSGSGQFIKAFGPNGGEHEFEISANGSVSLIAPNLSTNIQLNNANGIVTAKGFNNRSDKNAKTNFSSVSASSVLAKVAKLPITRWNYKDDAQSVQHIGPMAQDFEAAFGLNGGDGKHINTVDAQGVTLVAIQGLHQKLEQKDAQIKTLEGKLSALEARLNALENR